MLNVKDRVLKKQCQTQDILMAVPSINMSELDTKYLNIDSDKHDKGGVTNRGKGLLGGVVIHLGDRVLDEDGTLEGGERFRRLNHFGSHRGSKGHNSPPGQGLGGSKTTKTLSKVGTRPTIQGHSQKVNHIYVQYYYSLF